MLIYPQINPIAIAIGPIHIHWYGIMYLVGFLSAYWLARWRVRHYKLNTWNPTLISDLIFYAAMGVIIGGRIGYILFYNLSAFLHDPLLLFRIWEGGMSFHGGLLGVVIAVYLFARRIQSSFLAVADFITPLVPLGLAAGRLGNFINGELWGRVTDVPWAMVFPHVDSLPRHPSQLYEFGLEGLGLFVLVWLYASKPRPIGCVSAVFLIAYSICRLIIECVRAPDPQLGFVLANNITMGQCLSLPMLLIGLLLYFWNKKHANISAIS